MWFIKTIVCISLCLDSVFCGNVADGCWTDNTVHYSMIGFSNSEETIIKQNIDSIHRFVCLRWVEVKDAEANVSEYVKFNKVRGTECSAEIIDKPSRKGSFRGVLITLSSRCFKEKKVMHEMMHALGFTHEHQRADRNCYIEVSEDLANDESYKILHGGPDSEWIERFPYDQYSVLHYSRTNKMKAWSEKRAFNYREPLGNDKGELTILDIWKMMHKFCHFPHYCEVFPLLCELMEYLEKDCDSRKARSIA